MVQGLKFDLVWFGTLVAVNLQTAFLSPPVGMAAYYLKAVVPRVARAASGLNESGRGHVRSRLQEMSLDKRGVGIIKKLVLLT